MANSAEDSINMGVDEAVASNEETTSALEELKKKVIPYSSKQYLENVLNNMITLDGDYIRRYLDNNSNIIFQRDFEIADKNNFIFSKKAQFNNDSVDLDFIDDKVFLRFTDYRLRNSKYGYTFDVFLNGKLLGTDKYIQRFSEKEYNFNTGGVRLFIDGDLFDNDKSTVDIVSVVAKRNLNMPNYYKIIKIDVSDGSEAQVEFFIKPGEVGDYNNNFNNLIVFKKTENSSFIYLDRDNYCFSEEDGYLVFKITETPVVDGSSYLIMNKCKQFEINLDTISDYTEDEYYNNSTVNQTLVAETVNLYNNGTMYDLPMPVSCAEELEIYVNGLKLIPNVDYELINENPLAHQKIKYSGILKQNSIIRIRNINIDPDYGFYGYDKTLKTTSTDSSESEGFVILNKLMIPIDEYYVESYIGRHRIPICKKRSIANTILKIDDQSTIRNFEYHSEIEFDRLAKDLLALYNIEKPTLTRLSDTFTSKVIDSWKDCVDENNNYINDLLINSDSVDNSIDDIFVGNITSIELIARPEVITEGYTPSYTVIGTISINNDSEDTYKIDLTENSTISSFEPNKIGKQTVTATYTTGKSNTILETTLQVEVIPKEPIELKITTDSNFLCTGDKLKENISVIAYYADGSNKNVTSDCGLYYLNTDGTRSDLPEAFTSVGTHSIVAEYTYNETTLTETKAFFVTDTSSRLISNMYLLLDNYLEDGDNYSSISVFVKYQNNYLQQIDPDKVSIYDYTTENINSDTLIPDISHCSLRTGEIMKLYVKVFTDSNKTTEVGVVNSEKSRHIVSLKVFSGQIDPDNENNIVYYDNSVLSLHPEYKVSSKAARWSVRSSKSGTYLSAGSYDVSSDAICIGDLDLESQKYVIVEFFDANNELLNQVLFKLVDKNENDTIINGTLDGNGYDGYIIKINKFALGMEVDDINLESIVLTEVDTGNVVAKYVDDDYEYGYDFISEKNNIIYIHFNNFNTMSFSHNGVEYEPSVYAIQNFLIKNTVPENKLYLRFTENNVRVNISEVTTAETIRIGIDKSGTVINNAYFDFTNLTDLNFVIESNYTTSAIIKSAYHMMPVTSDGQIITNKYGVDDKIKLTSSYTRSLVLTDNYIGEENTKTGINRYYFVSGTGDDKVVYMTDVYITRILKKNDSGEYSSYVYVSRINDTYISLVEWSGFTVKRKSN